MDSILKNKTFIIARHQQSQCQLPNIPFPYKWQNNNRVSYKHQCVPSLFLAHLGECFQIGLDSGHVDRPDGRAPQVEPFLQPRELRGQFGQLVGLRFHPHAHVVIDEGQLARQDQLVAELDVHRALVLDQGTEVAEEQALSQGLGTDFDDITDSTLSYDYKLSDNCMRNSNSFQRETDKTPQSDSELPRQWDYLSKRLGEVEKGLTLLQKKHSKLDKKMSSYMQETSEFNTQLTQELLNLKSTMPSKREVQEDMLKTIDSLEKQIKSSCNELIATRFDTYSLSFHERNDGIQIKVRAVYDQAKAYVDRAVFELKELLKKYVREQGDLERKIEKSSRENSPSLMPRNQLSKSKSSKKLFETTQKSEQSEPYPQKSSTWIGKSRQSMGKESAASAGSGSGNRVSYLREKLKQFQKINKKYEVQPEKPGQKEEKDEIMKKMRNYKEYLEQSQSELEPSNILNVEDVASYSGVKKNNYSLF